MLDVVERRALRAVAAQFFVNGFIYASFVPRLPEIRDRIGVDLAGIGVLLTVGGLAGFASSVLVGRLVTRFGTRRLLMGAGVALSLSLPVMGFATTPAVFLVGAAALGASDVIVDVAMNVQGSRLSEKRHTPVMNRLHALWSVGTVLGGLLASWLAGQDVPLEAHLLTVGLAFTALVLLLGRLLLANDDPLVEQVDVKAPGSPPTSRRRVAIVFGLLGFAAIMPEMGTSDWVSFRLTDDLGLAAGQAGLGFVAFTTGMVVGRFSGDTAQLRWGRERVSDVSLGLAVVGIITLAVVPAFPAVLAGAALSGLGISVLFPLLYDDAARAGGSNAGALGAMTAGSRVAVLVLPFAVGGLASTSVVGVGGAMAAVSLPAIAIIFVLQRRFR
ncbi:MFS transporter [Euzebya tangerina]|uniref:MFS transporter n=1 Tax=Euzebya tangerina TaxID=591198 RepID=UPI0013C2A9FA|nr:MFS transporter [Euzebya tangerina]